MSVQADVDEHSSDTGLDLRFDDGQEAIASAVQSFCADHCDEDVVKQSAGSLPMDLWKALAELGVFALATEEGEAGAIEIVAAVESLGRAVFPGPVAATFAASLLLEGAELSELVSGERIVCMGVPPLVAFGAEASFYLEVEADSVFRSEPRDTPEPVATLGGEPWARLEFARGPELEGGARALLLGRIVRAAQLAAMADQLVLDASAHAAARRQFGTPIGDFQAVAHPLADCSMRLAAAGTMTRGAACAFDGAKSDLPCAVLAATALLSASSAALEASYVCHQIFGAIGITLEGPVFHRSRRIRQLASERPGDAEARTVLMRHYKLGDFGSRPEVGAGTGGAE